MGWWTEYASRNSSICGQNFLLEIAVFRDGGSIHLCLTTLGSKDFLLFHLHASCLIYDSDSYI